MDIDVSTQQQLEELDSKARWTAGFTGVMVLSSDGTRRELWKRWKEMSGGLHTEKDKSTYYPRSDSKVSFVVSPP